MKPTLLKKAAIVGMTVAISALIAHPVEIFGARVATWVMAQVMATLTTEKVDPDASR
jgi:hypothetical protein